jgi:uncharacterized OsmC-like protein
MEVFASFAGGTEFEIAARGHRVICDQPVANGGHDAGMTPPEFLLAALASCAAYYAAEYLKARQLSAAGLKVRVAAEKILRPTRLDEFRIEVAVPGLEDRHREGILRAVKSCLIHNTLLGAPRIEVALAAAPLQSEAEPVFGNAYRS